MDWELNGNLKSLESVIKAAYNLGSRFSEKTGAIRSWDIVDNKAIKISGILGRHVSLPRTMLTLPSIGFRHAG